MVHAAHCSLQSLCASLVLLMLSSSVAAQPLVDSVKRHDAAAVRALVASRVDVNAAQADGATPLQWAVYGDDLGIADLLLRAGARANAANELGVTPLSLACTNASATMVDRLLKGGADPNTRASRVPPIMTCARTGSLAAVQALIAAKADVNAREPARGQTALMWAAAQNHAAIVRALLQRGAQVTARAAITRLLINRADPNDIYTAVVGEISQGGSTPLLLAARQGAVDAARALLDAGANANDVAPDGSSALVIAAHSDHAAVAKVLLERGANPNVIGAGYTALHASVLRGNLDLVKALLAHGASVNSRIRNGTPTTRGTHDFFFAETKVGATPFWLAARFLEPDIMRALSAAGADTRLGLPDGTTPLMAAAGVPAQPPLFDRRDRLRLLRTVDEPQALEAVTVAIETGADVTTANKGGDTALHGAAAQNYPSVIALLAARGARVEARNRKGATPLAVATGAEARAALRKLGAK